MVAADVAQRRADSRWPRELLAGDRVTRVAFEASEDRIDVREMLRDVERGVITEVFNGYSPYGKPWELIMTVGVVMTLPIVVLVLFSQRHIIRGLVSGAIK